MSNSLLFGNAKYLMKSLKKLVLENNVCPIPWVHSEIFSSRTRIIPCCKYSEDIETVSNNFFDTWHGESFQKIRNDLENGIPHKNCSACDVPDHVFSYKKFKIQDYVNSGILENIDIDNLKGPRVLHLSTTDNTCNLACRMCNPDNSSKIAAMATGTKHNLKKFFKLNPLSETTPIIDYLRGSLDSIMRITISGGEPMLDKNLTSVIDLLSESNSLKTIGFSTNMTMLNYELLDRLNRLENVSIFFSISLDGPKPIHEYIRHGCEYDNIIENLKYISNNYKDRFDFNINSTISVYNAGYIKESLESFKDLIKETKIKINQIMSSPVLTPEFLHPGVLPDQIKELYLEKIRSIDSVKYQLFLPKSKEFLETTVRLIQENKNILFDEFLEFNKEFDKSTGENFIKIYPEFTNYMG